MPAVDRYRPAMSPDRSSTFSTWPSTFSDMTFHLSGGSQCDRTGHERPQLVDHVGSRRTGIAGQTYGDDRVGAAERGPRQILGIPVAGDFAVALPLCHVAGADLAHLLQPASACGREFAFTEPGQDHWCHRFAVEEVHPVGDALTFPFGPRWCVVVAKGDRVVEPLIERVDHRYEQASPRAEV